jgi:hypothetical protein
MDWKEKTRAPASLSRETQAAAKPKTPPPPRTLPHATLPLEPTIGTTRGVGEEGGGGDLVHPWHGGRAGWSGAPWQRGVLGVWRREHRDGGQIWFSVGHSRRVAASSGIGGRFSPPRRLSGDDGLVVPVSGAGGQLPARGVWFRVEWPPPPPLSVSAVSVAWRSELEPTPGVWRPDPLLVRSFPPPPFSSPCHWVPGASWCRRHPRWAPVADLRHVDRLGR